MELDWHPETLHRRFNWISFVGKYWKLIKATLKVIDRLVPSIPQVLLMESLKITKFAILSRYFGFVGGLLSWTCIYVINGIIGFWFVYCMFLYALSNQNNPIISYIPIIKFVNICYFCFGECTFRNQLCQEQILWLEKFINRC